MLGASSLQQQLHTSFFQQICGGRLFSVVREAQQNNERTFTPLKVNMEPNNEGLEDGFPCETGDFQVPC